MQAPGLAEQLEPLRRPPGLHVRPGAGLGAVRDEHRADLRRQLDREVGPRHRRLRAPAGQLDLGQVDRRLGADLAGGRGIGQEGLVPGGRRPQPPGVVVDHRPLEHQPRTLRGRHQRGGAVEVAQRGGQAPQLLVHRRPADQQLPRPVRQVGPLGHPQRAVEQGPGGLVAHRLVLGPGVGVQRHHVRLGLAGLPRALDQVGGRRAEPGGVAQDSLVDGLGLREHGAVGLAVHAPTLLLGKVGHDRRPRYRSDEAGRTRAVPRARPAHAGAGRAGRPDDPPPGVRARRRPQGHPLRPDHHPAGAPPPRPRGPRGVRPGHRAARRPAPAGRDRARASSSCAPGWTRRRAPRSRR